MMNDEKKWQREDDARTLAQAEEIKADQSRLDGARSEAAEMAKEQDNRTKALRRVAGNAKPTKNSKPSPAYVGRPIPSMGPKLVTNPGITYNQ